MKQTSKHYVDSGEVLNRLKKHFEVETDTELSVKIGVTRSTMSTWRNRNSFDYDIVLQVADLHNIDLNDLILGKPKDKKNINVPVVTNKYIDDYLDIKDNAELLNKLPTVNIIDLPKNFAYRGFQFAECFMAGLQPNGIAIGKLVLNGLEGVVDGLPYVVVLKNGRVICGRLHRGNVLEDTFRVYMDNIKNTNCWPLADLPNDEVAELWEIQSAIVKDIFNFGDDELMRCSLNWVNRELTQERAKRISIEKEFNQYRFLVMSKYGDR